MKKLSVILLLLAVIFTSVRTKSIASAEPKEPDGITRIISSEPGYSVIEFTSPDYEVSDYISNGNHFDRVSINNLTVSTSPGEPMIPVYNALLGLPPTGDVKFEILEDQAIPVKGTFEIELAPQPARITEDLQPGTWQQMSGSKITSQAAIYPSKPVLLEGDNTWLRDQRIARISFFPIQYHPTTGELIWHQRVRVVVKFDETAVQSISLDNNSEKSPFEPIFEQMLLNYHQAKAFRLPPNLSSAYASTSSSINHLDTPAYKIAIFENGIYRLTYQALQSAGLPVTELDPTTFQMLNQGDEISIFVSNSDGNEHVFSSSEYVLFYGEKFNGKRMADRYQEEDDLWHQYVRQMPDGIYLSWTPQLTSLMFEKYTDTNVYWLKYGYLAGTRMPSVIGTPGSAQLSTKYREINHEEKSTKWKTTLFSGEETWFWDEITTSSSATRVYTTTVTDLPTDDYSATIRGEIAANTNNDDLTPDHHIQIFWNDPTHTTLPVVDLTWDGKSRIQFEGSMSPGALTEGENELNLVVNKTSAVVGEDLYFDWFELEYDRVYTALDNRLIYITPSAGTWKYSIGGFTSGQLAVLNITEPITPTFISGAEYISGNISFELTHAADTKIAAAVWKDIPHSNIVFYSPPSFQTPVDYIYIVPEALMATLPENDPTTYLADFRASQGLSTGIYKFEDIINVFGDGIYHPLAIKNFLRYAFATWERPPTYVLLIGDGHWNFKSYPGYDSPPIYMPPFLAWVDPWQGEVDTSNQLAAVIGDDTLPDVLIGRMPVNSIPQLLNIVLKTRTYESNPYQVWQSNVLFVADNPDAAGDFEASSEIIINKNLKAYWNPQRIYLSAYGNNGQIAKAAIIDYINNHGALIINYTGHASLNVWAGENIFHVSDISSLDSNSDPSVYVSMTCLDGYWIHPNISTSSRAGPGLIEELLRVPVKGAVGAYSPTGLGVSTGHDALSAGFYEMLFQRDDWHLGVAGLAGKLRLYSTGSNYDLLQTYTVFGDPALLLLPARPIKSFLPLLLRQD